MDTPSLTKFLNKIKDLGIEPTKEVKDLYNKIIKQLKKETQTLQIGKTSYNHGLVEVLL